MNTQGVIRINAVGDKESLLEYVVRKLSEEKCYTLEKEQVSKDLVKITMRVYAADIYHFHGAQRTIALDTLERKIFEVSTMTSTLLLELTKLYVDGYTELQMLTQIGAKIVDVTSHWSTTVFGKYELDILVWKEPLKTRIIELSPTIPESTIY